MSNIWSLFEDYEQRYHGWLKESAVPKTTQWYKQSGIDQGLQNISTGLLGEKQWDPSGTKRVGGSLETAGGVVKDYIQRPTMQHHPNQQYGTYKGTSQFQKHAADAGIKSLEVTRDIVKWGVKKTDSIFNQMFPNANKNISTDEKKQIIKDNQKTDLSGITEQDGFSLAKWAGVNMDDVKKEWKEKGGFEGLMSNPAFTLGLALMQSSAQGKTIGEDVMNNFIKGAKLSEHYKDRIAARGEVVGPPSEAEMGVVERVLESKKYKTKFGVGATISKYLFGKDKEAQYHSTVSAIAAKVKQKSEAAAKKGKKVQITEDYVSSVVNEMIANKELEKGKGVTEGFLSGALFEMQPELKKKKGLAEGGPAQAGESYVVGEKGPEVFTPNVTGTVTANDDSQVMGMLLASNPQLQNVSKTRAESILRSRFPDYFA